MPFLDSLDIANAALQLCGVDQIAIPTEDSKANKETAFAYDKLRRPELRRNVWRFSIRKAVLRAVDADTMILAPTLYDATVMYLPGAIVSDANGMLWSSQEEDNLGNIPGDTNVWDAYFGPLTISPYDADVSYHAGELVYKPGTNLGSYTIFQSLENANDDTPDVATAWSATVTYHGNAIVSHGGFRWRSLIEVNLGITPAVGPAAWAAATTYSIGQTVTASDDFIYSSTTNANIGNNPVTNGGANWTNTGVATAWARTPVIPVSARSWRVILATMTVLTFPYPIGSGPSSQTGTLNVYRLPAGFLKMAPQDPKAGSISALGAPSGHIYDDWNLEGNYLISGDNGPLIVRFAADVTKVQDMDDMFCKGLACTIAAQICIPLTQSGAKLQTIASEYKLFMSEARTVNSIELGPVEPDLDDYIQCRA